jgi:hypothetical protein
VGGLRPGQLEDVVVAGAVGAQVPQRALQARERSAHVVAQGPDQRALRRSAVRRPAVPRPPAVPHAADQLGQQPAGGRVDGEDHGHPRPYDSSAR